MALTDENSGGFVATLPMAPAYGGGYGAGESSGFSEIADDDGDLPF